MTVYRVLSLPQFTKFPHKAAQLIWKLSKNKNAANGAIMRTSILGAYEFWNYDKVESNTEKIAKVTHWDKRCVGSCVIITSIIAHILNENIYLNPSQIITIAEKYDCNIKPYIEKSLSKDISELNLDEQSSMGYTLKTLSAGLWAYFNAECFETGLIKVINEGGDADTNASVACSLLGAKFGYNSIPQKYIVGLNKRNLLEEKYSNFIDILKRSL